MKEIVIILVNKGEILNKGNSNWYFAFITEFKKKIIAKY